MAEILGYDCNGKVLRAGDPILLIEVGNPRYKYLMGQQFTVIGPCPVFDDQVEFSAFSPVRPYTWISGPPCCMKKIPPEDMADDSETERIIGWQPKETENA